ncbi:DUF2182 domain-containing protein [Sphingomonas jaspsi]|uniref:DUF2182 domain-containing protein n=1 Tax=Sphingomonas jaspsi TaxID=392409 RepID=UPI0004B1A39D|nr:DUF2182 domain-containing protein [Sphingomonas jaspsi]
MRHLAEAALKRHRLVTLSGLAALTVLAWVWIWLGAGMERATPAPMPDMAMPVSWDLPRFALTLSMWWVMMVAMMTPSAAPVVLLYARAAADRDVKGLHSAAFFAGYLLAWLCFSLAAASLQVALAKLGWSDEMAMRLASGRISGVLLIAAGLYQLSALKDACLSRCRQPAQLLSRLYRPGIAGALRMGLIHGAICVGCCWLLMLLLFVGGVMNLLWVAGLTLLVAAEKLLPYGSWLAKLAGMTAIGWGFAMLMGF